MVDVTKQEQICSISSPLPPPPAPDIPQLARGVLGLSQFLGKVSQWYLVLKSPGLGSTMLKTVPSHQGWSSLNMVIKVMKRNMDEATQ